MTVGAAVAEARELAHVPPEPELGTGGNYLIWSPMIIVGDDPTLNSVCDWYVNGATFPSGDPNGYTFQYDSKDDKFGSAPMFGELTLTASTNTIITKCDTDSDNHPIGSGQMIALQVGDVN